MPLTPLIPVKTLIDTFWNTTLLTMSVGGLIQVILFFYYWFDDANLDREMKNALIDGKKKKKDKDYRGFFSMQEKDKIVKDVKINTFKQVITALDRRYQYLREYKRYTQCEDGFVNGVLDSKNTVRDMLDKYEKGGEIFKQC